MKILGHCQLVWNRFQAELKKKRYDVSFVSSMNLKNSSSMWFSSLCHIPQMDDKLIKVQLILLCNLSSKLEITSWLYQVAFDTAWKQKACLISSEQNWYCLNYPAFISVFFWIFAILQFGSFVWKQYGFVSPVVLEFLFSISRINFWYLKTNVLALSTLTIYYLLTYNSVFLESGDFILILLFVRRELS